jgi:hypothetical protein
MPWSIFREGGGQGAARTWAQDLLHAVGAPDTPQTEQFIYDWEVSEGGGGKYNPLNQGPVPGHPELTTTGSQYGGGAADYANWQAGIQGSVDYLNMSNYTAVKQALMAGNGPAARSALIASPWAASHYGGGSAFSNAPLPGQATALPPVGGDVTTASNASGVSWWNDPCLPLIGPLRTACENSGKLAQSGGSGVSLNPFTWLPGVFGLTDFRDLAQRFGLILLGTLFVLIGVIRFTETGAKLNPIKQVNKSRNSGLREGKETVEEVGR